MLSRACLPRIRTARRARAPEFRSLRGDQHPRPPRRGRRQIYRRTAGWTQRRTEHAPPTPRASPLHPYSMSTAYTAPLFEHPIPPPGCPGQHVAGDSMQR
jgi:hypothetical protein